jgi:hypothetical protein
MPDQHNANIPALSNQVAEDIPDIKENLEFHRDSFERLFETWSTSDNSASVLESAVGFSDGTYTYDFPTNGVAGNSIIMLGNSSTVVWMYLNTAPPGWKALSTGADMVLGISGGSDAYNVNGGNPDSEATWTIDCTHVHQWYNFINTTTDAQSYNSGGSAQNIDDTIFSGGKGGIQALQNQYSINADQYTTSVNASQGSWRPKASVGKLFQLDTA